MALSCGLQLDKTVCSAARSNGNLITSFRVYGNRALVCSAITFELFIMCSYRSLIAQLLAGTISYSFARLTCGILFSKNSTHLNSIPILI